MVTSSMATLNSCPPELCQRIFQFACTDDGATGRALSLVSKYIHSSSKHCKLQSIVINGADQATRFVLALQRTPEQYRHVSYLTIVNDLTIHAFLATNRGQLSSSPSPWPFVRATTKRLELGVHYYDMQCMQTNRRQDETIFTASLQILHLTSATLQTLYIDFQSMWQLIPANLDLGTSPWRVRSMPSLRELTICYGPLDDDEEDESLFCDHGSEGRGETALFPRLRYLDLAGLRIRLHPIDLYKRISKFAPALTHLRLPMPMAEELECALGLGVGVTPDRGTDDDGVALEGEPLTATSHTTSNSDALIRLGIPTHFQSPTRTTRSQKPSLLPTATLQRVYIQIPPAPKLRGPFSYEIEVYILKMDELKAIENRDERVVVLDCTMEDARMEDIVRGWDRERKVMSYE